MARLPGAGQARHRHAARGRRHRLAARLTGESHARHRQAASGRRHGLAARLTWASQERHRQAASSRRHRLAARLAGAALSRSAKRSGLAATSVLRRLRLCGRVLILTLSGTRLAACTLTWASRTRPALLALAVSDPPPPPVCGARSMPPGAAPLLRLLMTSSLISKTLPLPLLLSILLPLSASPLLPALYPLPSRRAHFACDHFDTSPTPGIPP